MGSPWSPKPEAGNGAFTEAQMMEAYGCATQASSQVDVSVAAVEDPVVTIRMPRALARTVHNALHFARTYGNPSFDKVRHVVDALTDARVQLP